MGYYIQCHVVEGAVPLRRSLFLQRTLIADLVKAVAEYAVGRPGPRKESREVASKDLDGDAGGRRPEYAFGNRRQSLELYASNHPGIEGDGSR